MAGPHESRHLDLRDALETEDGDEVTFEGEWTGRGEIEGYAEDGNYYELEVDLTRPGRRKF